MSDRHRRTGKASDARPPGSAFSGSPTRARVAGPTLFGNFSLVGVCHAYVDDRVVFKRLSGFNFPAHRDGEQLHAELLALFAAGKLRAIVGQEVSFGDLPAALDAMGQRQTVGRTVIRLS